MGSNWEKKKNNQKTSLRAAKSFDGQPTGWAPKGRFASFFFFFKAIGRAVYIYCSLSLSLSMETIEKEADKKGKNIFLKIV